MHPIGYISIAAPLMTIAALTMVARGKRYDDEFESGSDTPAPANDASGPDGGAVAARRPKVSLMEALRAGMPAMPVRMRTLPRDAAGQPIPYLLTQVARKSETPFGSELALAAMHAQKRCWICGDQLGRYAAFMTDALSSVTRVSRTPPAHHDCAKHAAMTGLMQPRDLKVALVWVTRSYGIRKTGKGHVYALGDAEQAFWFADGRTASRDEVMTAMQKGLPELYTEAHKSGDAALAGLDLQVARASRQFPPHAALVGA